MGQEQFEREVLYPLLKDSANILIRTHLRKRDLLEIDTDGDDWSVGLVLDYMPSVVAALPLSETSVVPGTPQGDVSFWLRIPYESLKATAKEFLCWFLRTAVSTGKARPGATEIEDKVLDGVAERVATNWQSTGF